MDAQYSNFKKSITKLSGKAFKDMETKLQNMQGDRSVMNSDLKDTRASLEGYMKDEADFKQKLDTAATTFDAVMKVKQEADRVEKEAWRGKVKAALDEFETREKELSEMLKWKEEAFQKATSLSQKEAMQAELEGLRNEYKEVSENADRARADNDEIARQDA